MELGKIIAEAINGYIVEENKYYITTLREAQNKR